MVFVATSVELCLRHGFLNLYWPLQSIILDFGPAEIGRFVTLNYDVLSARE